MLPAAAVVIRDGERRSVDPATLVPGDLVVLTVGNRVPADLRVVAAAGLKTECSSLTGGARGPLPPTPVRPPHTKPRNVCDDTK